MRLTEDDREVFEQVTEALGMSNVSEALRFVMREKHRAIFGMPLPKRSSKRRRSASYEKAVAVVRSTRRRDRAPAKESDMRILKAKKRNNKRTAARMGRTQKRHAKKANGAARANAALAQTAEMFGPPKPGEGAFTFTGSLSQMEAAVECFRKDRAERAANHPGAVPVLGVYHEEFQKLIGTDGEGKFTDGNPFAEASIGEMFAWYLGGANRSDDIWAPLREQSQAVRDLINCFDEYHLDRPEDFHLSGEWTERFYDISRRHEVLAWLHHRVVTKIRMDAVNARKAELAAGASS